MTRVRENTRLMRGRSGWPAVALMVILTAGTAWLAQRGEKSGGVVLTARQITMVDGDTLDTGGQRYRLEGYDTPETKFAKCDAERRRGKQARIRAVELVRLAGRIELRVLPGRDRYGRGLAVLKLDGRDLGEVLIGEGLARPYDGGARGGWCP